MKQLLAIAAVLIVVVWLVSGRVFWPQNSLKTPVPSPTVKPTDFRIVSPAFANGQSIPAKYTCDGENVSPPITISGVPGQAQSLVLIMDDPDAPAGTFTHWILMDMPLDAKEIVEGKVPDGTVAGTTSFGRPGYGGPCPKFGMHRYFFTLTAVDRKFGFNNETSREKLEQAMQGHTVGQTYFYGRYNRK